MERAAPPTMVPVRSLPCRHYIHTAYESKSEQIVRHLIIQRGCESVNAYIHSDFTHSLSL